MAGNQRSGTTLLSDALARTGLAGKPGEHFEQEGWRADVRSATPGVSGADIAGRLAEVFSHGTTPNRVFGAKVMWNTVGPMLTAFRKMPECRDADPLQILRDVFPSLRLIVLVRRDRVRQAVSWARAARDGVWHTPVDDGVTANR